VFYPGEFYFLPFFILAFLIVPGHTVDIWYQVSSLPDAFVFIYCMRAGSSRAQRMERRSMRYSKRSFRIIPTNFQEAPFFAFYLISILLQEGLFKAL
jgi:hypothetical protein